MQKKAVKKTQKKKPVIQPRKQQPLTKKRKSAIYRYVRLKTIDGVTVEACIKHTIVAERMEAEKLYSYMDRKGYIWDSSHGGYWREKKR